MNPAKHRYTVLAQICKLIPGNLVSKLARKYEVDKKSRSFSPWSHIVSMIYSQLAHSLSLNDIADSLRNNRAALQTIRNATPPSRNGLSHANKIRDGKMAEDLFFQMLSHMKSVHPKFGYNHKFSGVPRRFKKTISAVDSTTINLVANCLNWAKHRRRKAAAKCHMQLNLQTFLPQFAIVKSADSHDSVEAKELCSNLKDGEIVVFDKAYIDFKHLKHLSDRGIFWVTRAKSNMQYRSMGQHSEAKGKIFRDEVVQLTGARSRNDYPDSIRIVEAEVLVDGKEKVMTFITNNFKWAPSSICDLYKSRWGIEVFFKQIKQTLQLADFLGYSENAVMWQVWIALLCYILLRFISEISKWDGSFRRLFTLLRAVLFQRLDMNSVVECCSKTRGSPRMIAAPEQTYLPGF